MESTGQQLYAKIKKTSKYFGQGEPGALFPVYIDPTTKWEYCVTGSPGEQYRLKDVNLFVVAGGRELRIS